MKNLTLTLTEKNFFSKKFGLAFLFSKEEIPKDLHDPVKVMSKAYSKLLGFAKINDTQYKLLVKFVKYGDFAQEQPLYVNVFVPTSLFEEEVGKILYPDGYGEIDIRVEPKKRNVFKFTISADTILNDRIGLVFRKVMLNDKVVYAHKDVGVDLIKSKLFN